MGFTSFNKENHGDLTKSNRQNTEARLGRIPRTVVDDADYTAAANDFLIVLTNLTASRTITVDATKVKEGKQYIIKDETGNAGSNNIVIDPAGSQTIDGATTQSVNANYSTIKIYSNGTNWFTL